MARTKGTLCSFGSVDCTEGRRPLVPAQAFNKWKAQEHRAGFWIYAGKPRPVWASEAAADGP